MVLFHNASFLNLAIEYDSGKKNYRVFDAISNFHYAYRCRCFYKCYDAIITKKNKEIAASMRKKSNISHRHMLTIIRQNLELFSK